MEGYASVCFSGCEGGPEGVGSWDCGSYKRGMCHHSEGVCVSSEGWIGRGSEGGTDRKDIVEEFKTVTTEWVGGERGWVN